MKTHTILSRAASAWKIDHEYRVLVSFQRFATYGGHLPTRKRLHVNKSVCFTENQHEKLCSPRSKNLHVADLHVNTGTQISQVCPLGRANMAVASDEYTLRNTYCPGKHRIRTDMGEYAELDECRWSRRAGPHWCQRGAPYIPQQSSQSLFLYRKIYCSIHKARVEQNWLATQPEIKTLCWPSRSPDLSPTDNLWGIMIQR